MLWLPGTLVQSESVRGERFALRVAEPAAGLDGIPSGMQRVARRRHFARSHRSRRGRVAPRPRVARRCRPRGALMDERLLLQHSEWVRQLARSLVHDANQADDVQQRTWLAALERPPADTRNIRGWLRQVLHNAARQACEPTSPGARTSRRRLGAGDVHDRAGGTRRLGASPGRDGARARGAVPTHALAALLRRSRAPRDRYP